MLIVTGTLSVAPSDLADFVADLRPLAASTRLRDGNLCYHIAVLDAATGQLLVAERWRDQAALAAHLRSFDTVSFMSRWQGRSQSDARVFDASDERLLAAE